LTPKTPEPVTESITFPDRVYSTDPGGVVSGLHPVKIVRAKRERE